MIDIPVGYVDSKAEIMSGDDHKINQKVLTTLMIEEMYAKYIDSDFFVNVWYLQRVWYGKVQVYGVHVETVTALSCDQLLIKICDKYGHR